MIDDLYSAKILGLAANMPRSGRLTAPDASSEKVAKLCGSRVVVDVKMDGGRVIDFAQDVKACALGQAAASVLGEHVIGASVRNQLVALRVPPMPSGYVTSVNAENVSAFALRADVTRVRVCVGTPASRSPAISAL